ncbi:ABC transporter substrate-binding protein [Siccirubricoccus phaeus]|uniref:ABC transporter substrate-binding protein n=1 Tax=Siccirubricoccus phaeus TaxID=2595053 RepID=UPI0011F282A7|nr:ABC transporter substrate-binding protein [Siccirubricoccus phaeus]
MIARRSLLAGAAGAAAATLAGPAIGQALVKTSFGPTTTDISTGHAAHSSLPRALGYWKDEGLDVDVFGVAGNTAGLQLISAGNIDFITIVAEELLTGRARGMPIKGAYMHARQPIARIVVPKASGITSLAQLKGKTMGMPVIGPSPYSVAAFKEAGVNFAEDIKLVATGTGAPALLALRRGDIAGWISWDTAVAGLENRGMEFTELRPGFFDQLIGNIVITREEVFRTRPELIVKMCRGIAKAAHFGLTNPEAAIRIHWQVYPQTKPQGGDPAKVMEEAKRVFLSRFSAFAVPPGTQYGATSPSQWELVTKQMQEAGELPAGFDAGAAFTSEYLAEINNWDRGAIEAQAKAWNG